MKLYTKLIAIACISIFSSCKKEETVIIDKDNTFTYGTRKMDFSRLDSTHVKFTTRDDETLFEDGVKLNKIQFNLTTENLSKKDSSVIYSGQGSIIDLCISYDPKVGIPTNNSIIPSFTLKGGHGGIETDVDTENNNNSSSTDKRDLFLSGNMKYIGETNGIRI